MKTLETNEEIAENTRSVLNLFNLDNLIIRPASNSAMFLDKSDAKFSILWPFAVEIWVFL